MKNLTGCRPKYVRDVQPSPYDEGLAFVGLKLTRSDSTRPAGEKFITSKIENCQML